MTDTPTWPFDNTYARLPAHFFARLDPARVPQPELFAWNAELAEQLGLAEYTADRTRLAQIFSGNELPPGAEPLAMAYAGHQFGNFVPQLGDGRAHLIGEIVDRDGMRRDLQFKGSGRTPFSRNGDGKAALGPVIREYLVSEAMYHLGVPTARSLAAVTTGEWVLRDRREPGGIVTRVASSHLRIGTFEFFAARRDNEAIQRLVDYAIARHDPDLAEAEQPGLALFERVAARQAELVAHWMDLGFIHGVMNTDNMLLSGETIDYGPCAFMDEFDYHKVFSSIDYHGRYAYGQQGRIAQWNLARLAECLLAVGGEKSDYQAVLERFAERFEQVYLARMGAKLGLEEVTPQDQSLIERWLQHLQDESLDYTLSFRQLMAQLEEGTTLRFGEVETAWRARIEQQPGGTEAARRRMAAVNPARIPRNHQVEMVIEAAREGDFAPFDRLQAALREPFEERPEFADLAVPPLPQERVMQTFCGT